MKEKRNSGYFLFAHKVRKRVLRENPDLAFREVRQLIQAEWKELSDEQKLQSKVEALKIAEKYKNWFV